MAPSRWRYPALLACVFLLSFGLAWGIQMFRRAPDSAAVAPAGPSLELRIWRADAQFQPLLQALPLREGDEVQVRCRVPGGRGATLYLVNASGKMQSLAQFPAQAGAREIVFPQEEESKRLEGQPGTEMILVLGGTGNEPPAPGEAERLWAAGGPEREWPALPPAIAVRLRPDGVDLEGERGRDLGETNQHFDPLARVRQRLDAFRQRLLEQFPYFEGEAFAHE